MVKELPVMLLVMMLAFFRADPPCNVATSNNTSSSGAFGSTSKNNSINSSGQPKKPKMVLQQPEKVMRIHDYYMHKLQVTAENILKSQKKRFEPSIIRLLPNALFSI